jgi:hypothetical protein
MKLQPAITLTFAITASLLLGTPLGAAGKTEEVPDLTKLAIKETAQLPETPTLSWNLGPTGARGWVYGNHGPEGIIGSQILVTVVEPGSPADGVLQKFDVLLGANGKAFVGDARRGLGEAITDSETTARKGLLKLTRWRNGSTSEVQLHLEVMGEYAATAPFGCPKSHRILDGACRYLVAQMPPDGFHSVGGYLDALLLLSTGNPDYLDCVRRTAYRIGPPDLKLDTVGSLQNWNWGYSALLLAEYYLATGDRYVLPALKEYSRALAEGQALSGSWAHEPADHGMAHGYGEVNAVGMACFTAMILAKECGVEVDQAALARGEAFFRRWAGRGNVPYGDHLPWLGRGDNGKTAQAAIIYDLLGERDVVAQYAPLVAAAWADREIGHSGNFFSYTWGPLGAARAGQPALSEFLFHQRWYYDLARRWDHSLGTQPITEPAEGKNGMTNYVSRGGPWGTGGMALVLSLPQPRLRILGSAKHPPDHTLTEKSIKSTLVSIKADMAAGDLWLAKCKLDALLPVLSAKDASCAAWEKTLADPANPQILDAGKRFYEARSIAATDDLQFAERYVIDRHMRGVMTGLAASKRAGAYQAMAAKLISAKGLPELGK